MTEETFVICTVGQQLQANMMLLENTDEGTDAGKNMKFV